MRLIDAELFEKQLRQRCNDAKAKKQSYSTYEKVIKLLSEVPTANPTCHNCGTVLAGEIHERQTINPETN